MNATRREAVLARVLDEAGVGYELLGHERTETAAAEAAALDVPPHEVAKTVVVTTGEGNVRVVVPGSERIDMHKLRELLSGGKEVHLLTEDDLARDYPEFELGAVPPIGGREDAVVVDTRLAARDHVLLEAGAHDRSARVSPADLVAVARATTADVCL
ncbi:MAG: YbaK/EbsC family protein, partial [Thermoleophilia bacterium]|nr:YbaK/EbsC family protein [Thermoleophilia bacterium]